MFRYYSVSTSNWGDKVELPAKSFTGGRVLNGGTGGSASFDVLDADVSEVITQETIAPLERLLVATWDGNAVYAGFITDVEEDLDAGTVTVNHQDIWWLWQRRYILLDRGAGAAAAAPITWTARSLPTLLNSAMSKGMDGDPAARYNLPVIRDDDVAGSYSKTYFGYEFVTVADAFDELLKLDAGTYVDFDTQWVGIEYFRWVMRSGSLTQGFWEWDATAEKSDVSQLKFKTNAQNVVNRVIGTGEGSERDRLVREASSFGSSAPALERVMSLGGKTGDELQALTTAALNITNDATQQISFRIPVDGAVKLSELILGGTARVKTSGIRFLSAGWHDWRLIQFDFDQEWITLQFQQIGG